MLLLSEFLFSLTTLSVGYFAMLIQLMNMTVSIKFILYKHECYHYLKFEVESSCHFNWVSSNPSPIVPAFVCKAVASANYWSLF